MLAFNNVSFHPHFLRSFLLSVKGKSMAPRGLQTTWISDRTAAGNRLCQAHLVRSVMPPAANHPSQSPWQRRRI